MYSFGALYGHGVRPESTSPLKSSYLRAGEEQRPGGRHMRAAGGASAHDVHLR
jgi:hypothetical protein